MSAVLITGGTGFVGAHLVRACLARGDSVTVLARHGSATGRLEDVLPQITLLRADPNDATAVRAAVRQTQANVIFHLGATTRFDVCQNLQDAAQSVSDNLTPLITLLAAAIETPPEVLVRTGTIAEYGNVALPYLETRREAPQSAYGASMLAGTQYIEAMRSRLPFQAITARLALTYGPMQSPDFLIPQLIASCCSGDALTIRRPMDRRDLIHVDDVVRGLLTLADRAADAPDVVNLSTGHAPTMAQLAKKLTSLSGARTALLSFENQKGAATELIASAILAERALGWKASISLEEGLEQTLHAALSEARATAGIDAPALHMTGTDQ